MYPIIIDDGYHQRRVGGQGVPVVLDGHVTLDTYRYTQAIQPVIGYSAYHGGGVLHRSRDGNSTFCCLPSRDVGLVRRTTLKPRGHTFKVVGTITVLDWGIVKKDALEWSVITISEPRNHTLADYIHDTQGLGGR